MTPDESRQQASEAFDEATIPPANPAFGLSEDWAAWDAIATHLHEAEVAVLPADFGARVKFEIQRARFRRDLGLMIKVGVLTSIVLTIVTASVLGFDWWRRLSAAVRPSEVTASLNQLAVTLEGMLAALAPLARIGERIWPHAPMLLLTLAILTVTAEFAVLRVLRLGPFRSETALL